MDCGFAGAAFRGEVDGNVVGDLMKRHPVDPGCDERLQFGIGVNPGRATRATRAVVSAVICGWECGGVKGVQAVSYSPFNCALKGD